MNVKRKELNKMVVRNDLHKMNDLVEDKIWKDSIVATRNYEDLPVDIFNKLQNAQLIGFVHVQTDKKDEWRNHKNKESVSGAKNGDDNNLI